MSVSQSSQGSIPDGPLERPHNPSLSTTQALVPLLAVGALSLTIGLLPYAVVRRQLVQQRRLISELHADIKTGNCFIAELTKSHEVDQATRRLHEQNLQVELHSSLQSVEEKYQSAVLAQERDMRTLKEELAKSTVKTEELEDLITVVGNRVAKAAALIEEEQVKAKGGAEWLYRQKHERTCTVLAKLETREVGGHTEEE
ncbi:SubName: Full=Uncharacterized protein {ECO:0000313/EMBL:CCA71216.1} [Serendipita indica DSM 11827]|nr:SubName: Full=Uncharacterized protein {ECO:0000313/EMBL:CCA71216.1} [Serendipita indica DSM 11827]